MPRYEYSKDGSSKFWEIRISGSSFTTTYGKIGSDGKSTSKSFDSTAAAKKAADKLAAAKVKKGYALVKGKSGTKSAKAKPAAKAKAKPAAKEKPAAKAKAAAKTKPAAKAKAKPAAKTKPIAKATAATPGARYFEFTDGSSSKFWEVKVKGAIVTTRYGKIGADGRATSKTHSSAAAAKKEGEKLVAQKSKKGYLESGAAPGQPATTSVGSDPRNRTLEAAILADPTDEAAFAVLGDWLQEQADPRGELIALQQNGKAKKAKALLAKNSDYFLGPLAEHQEVYDEGWNNAVSSLRTASQEKEWQKTHRQAFLWRNGYIHRIRLSKNDYGDSNFEGELADILKQALKHPSGRFAGEFAFHSNGDNEDNVQDLINVLGKMAPSTTRKITFGDNVDQISWHHTGSLKSLWKGVPNLEVLEIETGSFDVGKMVAPKLERAIFITGGLSKTCGRGIAKANMPNIKHLEIYYGDPDYGGDCSVKEVQPLLVREDLESLEYLGLKNAMFANDIAKLLAGAPILDNLKTLDLSLGAMTDVGAQALAAAKDSFAHLECLNLSQNFLTKDGIKAVKGLCTNVVTTGQQ